MKDFFWYYSFEVSESGVLETFNSNKLIVFSDLRELIQDNKLHKLEALCDPCKTLFGFFISGSKYLLILEFQVFKHFKL